MNQINIFQECVMRSRKCGIRTLRTQDSSAPKQSKAKMCNGRRHVPLCPASANEKYIVQKCNYNTMLSSIFI